jgi:hypothetical protein
MKGNFETRIEEAFGKGVTGQSLIRAYRGKRYDEMRTIAAATVKGLEDLIGMDVNGEDEMATNAPEDLVSADQANLRLMKSVEAQMQELH